MSEIATTRIDGRHVLAGLVAFFAVMLIANSVFVYFAVTTFGGLDTEDAYRKGLAYNATLAQASIQAELGWKTDLAYDAGHGRLALTIADTAGQPVNDLDVSGRLVHPANGALDIALGRFEQRGDGRYILTLDPQLEGAWIADLVLASSRETPFRMRQRLWLPPKS